jgi:starch-binding outer membrane protein, SusD/RagB family
MSAINLKYYCVYLILLLHTTNSCKKFVDVNPPITQLVPENVFKNDETAISSMLGIYARMMSSNGFVSGNGIDISTLTGLSSDELRDYSTKPDQNEFYNNAINVTNSSNRSLLWGEGYQYIFFANSILEGLSSSNSLSQTVKKQLEGEARFIRAFCNFYLVNLYGNIPLILSTDYKNNSISPQVDKSQIYNQIVLDLKAAQNLLTNNYVGAANETTLDRVRPNKWVATAFLARVYLYLEDWGNSEDEATNVLNNATFRIETDLNKVFLKDSKEAIWQLMPVRPTFNTNEGSNFILVAAPTNIALTSPLVNSFDSSLDKRRKNWIGTITSGTTIYYYPYKYKIRSGGPGSNPAVALSEYSMVIRLGEMYLIRSEARAQQNKISGAKSDLDVIRSRAGLGNTTANTQAALLTAIEQERQWELFTEGGHRWLDLKRTNRANIILSAIKGSNWQATDVQYPVPLTEIQTNPNLFQNLGY